MPIKIVHEQPLRESASIRVEILADSRIRTGLWRDDVLVAGFAMSAADARELRSALGLAIREVEA